MLHINNLFLYDNVVIDKTFNGRVDGDEEGRRLAGELTHTPSFRLLVSCYWSRATICCAHWKAQSSLNDDLMKWAAVSWAQGIIQYINGAVGG